MPLLETAGSGSARSFGLNSGVNEYGSLTGLTQITSYGGVSGINAVYTADSWDPVFAKWYDLSGNKRHADEIKNAQNINKSTNHSNTAGVNKSFTTIWAANNSENKDAGIRLPAPVYVSTNYTFFGVIRVYNSTTNRLIDGLGANWLAGTWGGNTGVFHFNTWLVNNVNQNPHGNNWILVTCQESFGRTNSVTRTNGTAQINMPSDVRPTILYGNHGGEASDWAVAEFVHYNRQLNSTEYTNVENALKTKYGFTY